MSQKVSFGRWMACEATTALRVLIALGLIALVFQVSLESWAIWAGGAVLAQYLLSFWRVFWTGTSGEVRENHYYAHGLIALMLGGTLAGLAAATGESFAPGLMVIVAVAIMYFSRTFAVGFMPKPTNAAGDN